MPVGKVLGSTVHDPSGKASGSTMPAMAESSFDTAAYDELIAGDAVTFIQSSDDPAGVIAYERDNKARSTVLRAFEQTDEA